jgi:hypothetical protein
MKSAAGFQALSAAGSHNLNLPFVLNPVPTNQRIKRKIKIMIKREQRLSLDFAARR